MQCSKLVPDYVPKGFIYSEAEFQDNLDEGFSSVNEMDLDLIANIWEICQSGP